MRLMVGYVLLFLSSTSFAADENWTCTSKDLEKMALGSDIYYICSEYIVSATFSDAKSDLVAIYTRYYEKTGDSAFHKKIEEINEFESVSQKYNSLVCSLRSDITGYEPLRSDQCPESFWNEKNDILIPAIESLINNPPSKDGDPISINNFSPSFNCNYSKSSAEKIICKSYVLSKLDVNLSKIYKSKTQSIDKKISDEIKKDQIMYISKRNECTSWACIRSETLQRISELEGLK